MKTLTLFFVLLINFKLLAHDISIITDQNNLQHPVAGQSIQDVQKLLSKACSCDVLINDNTSHIQLQLPKIDSTALDQPSRFGENANYPYLHYPIHDYSWTSKKEGAEIIVKLKTSSFQGISCGLYGLLQEQLGFLFFHPRETIMPDLGKWPLPVEFEWKAMVRFDKKGFHLHTQHPLELTEALMDPEFPDGLAMIKEYLDWLARNQQNYFEFNLLEGIDLNVWPHYAKQFVDYGHSRGLLMGVDISLHMIQQKSFMLYKNPPASFRSKAGQLDRNIERLFVADWDVWSVEFSTTEFTGGNVKKKQALQLHLTKALKKHGALLTGRVHVVKESEEVGGGNNQEYEMTAEEKTLDKARGTLIHTVMFYTVSEEKAPVYQNENLRHMLDLLVQEKDHRETWYYPESAYWITFDNSVPMLLLSYLSARLNDILVMDSLGIPGHLTFSSGWEWGYWLIDWSIARWSWKHEWNGQPRKDTPTMFLRDIFDSQRLLDVFEQSIELQDTYFKEKDLMKFMVAQTITDELPPPLNLQLAPRPEWTLRWFRNNADMELLDETQEVAVDPLLEFHEKALEIVTTPLYTNHPSDKTEQVFDELIRGLTITALRAKHKANTLSYLISKRRSELTKQNVDEAFLENAVAIREDALALVKKQESLYRYPVDLLARRHWSHTAYNYGYLYPPSNLHFWFREEEQLRKDKYGPLFMNIWDITRIIGLTE